MAKDKLSIDVIVEAEKAIRELREVAEAEGAIGKQAGTASAGVDKMGSSFSALKAGALAGGIAAAGLAVFEIGKQAVESAARMENFQIQFETILGSTEKANALVKTIQELGAKTPFQFPELADTTKLLINFGSSQERAIEQLKMLGDVASGSGTDMKELGLVFGQVQGVGKLTGERLIQFTERGIPLMATMSKQLGVTNEEFQKMVSAGQISSAQVEEAFKTMTSEGGQFFGSMEKQSASFDGIMSTLKDNLDLVLVEIGGPLLTAMKEPIAALTTALSSDQVQGAIKQVTGLMERLQPIISRLIEQGFKRMAAIMSVVMKVFEALAPIVEVGFLLFEAVEQVITDLIEIGAELLVSFIEPLIPLFEEIADSVREMMPQIRALAEQFGELLKQGVPVVQDVVIPLITKFVELAAGIGRVVMKLASLIGMDGMEGAAESAGKAQNKISVLIGTLKSGEITLEQAEEQIRAWGLSAEMTDKALAYLREQHADFIAEVETGNEVVKKAAMTLKEWMLIQDRAFAAHSGPTMKEQMDAMAKSQAERLAKEKEFQEQMKLTARDHDPTEEQERQDAIELKSMEASIALAEEKERAKVDAAQHAFGQLKDLMGDDFEAQKAIAFVEAGVNTALAATKALTAGPVLGPILAAAIGAMGAVQMAKIASAKAPGFAEGGYTGNVPTDQVAGFVHGQEHVMNAPATAKYRAGFDAMNAGASPAEAFGVEPPGPPEGGMSGSVVTLSGEFVMRGTDMVYVVAEEFRTGNRGSI